MIFLENSLSQIHHKNPGSCGFRSRQTCRSGSRVSAGNLSTFQMRHRGEYFYLSNVHCCLIFFRAEIFHLECFVQKYSYYGALCKNIGQVSLHITRPSRFSIWIWPEKTPFLGFVQKYYFFWGSCRNITVPSYCIAAILCRASFRVCAEISVFGRNVHLWLGIVTCYTAITIFYLDLTRKNAFFVFFAEILLFLGMGFVQKYYCPELLHSGFLVQGLF